MEIMVVYDNDLFAYFLKSEFGFSVLIDKKILFDTGADGKLLLENLKKLRVKPKKIEKVFLSHHYWDHVNGLTELLSVNKNITVYLLESFPMLYKREISTNAKIVEISEPTKIAENIYTTGMLGNTIKEQSMIIKTEKGIFIIAGSSHCGVEEILKAGRLFGELYGIIGGFGGFDKFHLLKDLQLISPMHDTTNKKEMKDLYPKPFYTGGAGRIFEI